jgi:perosamine synthetase
MAEMMAAEQRASGALAVDGGAPVADPAVPMIVVRIEDDEKQAVMGVLDSGILAQGPRCAELEEAFAAATGAKHGLTCANGTAALQLAYQAVIEPGDDVLVPAWTFVATASMVLACGANPIWCDADRRTYNIDVEDARRKVTPKTRAIVATHLYGAPVNIDGVQQLAADHGLRVVYDAAQAHLGTYDGRGLGAFGDIVTYSFYATKNMTTGEGGFITTNDDELLQKMKWTRSHGETQKYLHEVLGYNLRMNDMTASIGLRQLAKLPDRTTRRRAVAARYDAGLADVPGLLLPRADAKAESVYHLYTLQIDPDRFSCSRDEFIEALRAEGVGCAVHYPRAAARQPMFEAPDELVLPVADHLGDRVFSIPMHPYLTDEQVDLVIAAIRKVVNAYAR